MPPLSSKEKQEAFRARNAMLGLTEVRGIFLPPALHKALKEHAKKLLNEHAAKAPSTGEWNERGHAFDGSGH